MAPTVAAPALARAGVAAWLAHEPDGDAFIEDAKLVISELVTNCIRHARIVHDEPLRLTALLGATILRLELRDNGIDGTVARRQPRRDGNAGGYGLELVARLSSTWGAERDADGTTVWLELSVPADGTA